MAVTYLLSCNGLFYVRYRREALTSLLQELGLYVSGLYHSLFFFLKSLMKTCY